MYRFACLFVAAIGALGAPAVAGPTSEWFIANFGYMDIDVVQNKRVIRHWRQRHAGMPLAVINTVRTFGYEHHFFGSEYDLYGNWLGVDYYDQGGPTNRRPDGGTDGRSRNFLAAYDDQGIWQYDLHWKNPVRLFSTQGGPTGVTYDLMTNNLWVIEGRRVVQYTTDGIEVSSFSYTTPRGFLAALSYEPATDTLWALEPIDGRIYQFNKSGTVLDSAVIRELAGVNAVGGEFAIPEPGALLLIMAALPWLVRRR